MSMQSNKQLQSVLRRLSLPLLILSFVMIAVANYLVFFVVPSEKVMGAVQRIFYFHVGSAFASYVSFAIVFMASIFFLTKKERVYDAINRAAAEVGFLFSTIVLFTGMIWGKAAWGTWFNPEPRLISFLLIWLIFLAFIMLRSFADYSRVREHSAVLAIIGSVTVPLMVYSIKILPAFKQLHPQVVEKQGLPSIMLYVMLYTGLSLIVFQFLLVVLRTRLALLEDK